MSPSPSMGATLSPDTVADRLDAVRRRIAAAGADPDRVTIVAVTKGFGPDAIVAARRAGLHDLGENYADELVGKAEQAADGDGRALRWHFLGALQRNKVKRLAAHVGVWEGIDRPAAAEAVAARAPGATVLVQVNVAGDPAKHGCAPDVAADLVARSRALGLDVHGLMAVGPAGDREGARQLFRSLACMAADLALPGLSMGMSDDYDVAVSEGATTIRLGRALFGARPTDRRPTEPAPSTKISAPGGTNDGARHG